VIKTLEAQLGQLLLGCKCPVSRYLPGRAKDFSAPSRKTQFCQITYLVIYSGADKTSVRPTSLSIVFSVQGTGGSPKGPDPENRVCDQDIGSTVRPVTSGLQVSGEPLPSWSG
jgi:hypothetical protein